MLTWAAKGPTLSCSTRSIRYLHRGLMSLRISAVMMSMPLDSCVTMQVWREAGVAGDTGPGPPQNRGSSRGLGLSPARPAPSSPMSTLPGTAPTAHLVLVAGALAILGEGLQGLDDEAHVVLVDVEPQQPQTARGAAAHDVQELQSLAHQVVVGLVVLAAQEVLKSTGGGGGGAAWHRCSREGGARLGTAMLQVAGVGALPASEQWCPGRMRGTE